MNIVQLKTYILQLPHLYNNIHISQLKITIHSLKLLQKFYLYFTAIVCMMIPSGKSKFQARATKLFVLEKLWKIQENEFVE